MVIEKALVLGVGYYYRTGLLGKRGLSWFNLEKRTRITEEVLPDLRYLLEAVYLRELLREDHPMELYISCNLVTFSLHTGN